MHVGTVAGDEAEQNSAADSAWMHILSSMNSAKECRALIDAGVHAAGCVYVDESDDAVCASGRLPKVPDCCSRFNCVNIF